jgi:hypothetical protein
MWGALFMADTIRADLRDMGAVVWVLWQPDWNVIAFDPQGGAPRLKKQFFALAQYTRFIRPSYEIISAGGAYNTLAAYSPQSKRLVLVSTNWDTDTPNNLDLSAFGSLPLAFLFSVARPKRHWRFFKCRGHAACILARFVPTTLPPDLLALWQNTVVLQTNEYALDRRGREKSEFCDCVIKHQTLGNNTKRQTVVPESQPSTKAATWRRRKDEMKLPCFSCS